MKPCFRYLFVVLLLPFVVAFAPHDEDLAWDSALNASAAGIGGDGPFEAVNIELLGHLRLGEYGGGPANILGADIWGWTDPMTNKEYAICGLMHATSFVDISDPRNPQYLGRVMTQTGVSSWRDMKVYNDYVFIVSDGNSQHGMQIFDLTRLRTADPNNPQDFTIDAWYNNGIDSAHNVAINEDTGFAYVVGADTAAGGLHAVNIQDPLNPVFAGEFASDGYTHDAAVFSYNGPDPDYAGREIAFACNIDSLTIVDVTDKSNMTQISRNEYPQSGYTHQCWITDDHRYVYVGDEFDENNHGGPTRIIIFDCLDLDAPVYMGFAVGETNSVDHNLFIKGNYVYLGNYSAGMRVMEINPNDPLNWTELGYVDSYMADNDPDFDGVWAAYPFFDSGNVIFQDRQNGLFIVRLSELHFEYANPRPELIDPSGGVEFSVQVVDGVNGMPSPNSAVLHLDRGSGFESFVLNDTRDHLYDVEFPTTDCGSVVRYYLSAVSNNGTEVRNPTNAPDFVFTAKSADSESLPFADDFEMDLGWTVDGDAAEGHWERGVPMNDSGDGAPSIDADGSGSCYLTSNQSGNSDVDDGTTILTSPTMDAIGDGTATAAFLNYHRWFTNSEGNEPAFDSLKVEISNDDGQNWTLVEEVGPSGNEVSGGWFCKSFEISDIVTPTDQMRVRFIVADLNSGSRVEAGVDGVQIQLLNCDPTILLGDVNLDGFVDLLDVQPFVDLLNSGEFQAEADMNQDGFVNLLDVALFVQALND